MRIALVCPYAWDRFGGVQTHVGALRETLSRRGHDVVVVAPATSRTGIAGDGVALVGRAIPIPANGSVAPLAFGPLAAAGVRRALASFKPDVLHVHEPLAPSLPLLALLASSLPAVGTFHAAAASSLGYALTRPVLARAAARLEVRTAVSDAARALVARYFPGDYLLTPNGVDAGRFADAPPLDLGGGKKVLFFGRIERRKGLLYLIQAMARIRDLGAELVVAGAGPGERAAADLAAKIRVDARFLGRVPEEDKPRLFRRADVYCAPGLGGESFGIVLLEAMAAGTPVVCSDLPGFRDVAAGAALLAPPGDANELARVLRRVLSDPDEGARLGEGGRRRAQMFDWARLAAGVEAAYERALAGPRSTV